MRRLLLLPCLLALAGAAVAQTFPPTPKGTVVYDGANLLSNEDANAINALSRAFLRDTGAPIVVATFPSLESVGAKGMGIERYSTALFNQWRIGRKTENGGILLLVAKDDRKVRIELGKDWKHDYDAGAKSINQSVIVPAFKRGDYAGGIRRGCEALSHLADRPAGAGAGPAGPPVEQAPFGMPEEPMSGMGGVSDSGIGGFIGAGLCTCGVPILLVVVVGSIIASRRRRNYGYGGPYNSTVNSGPYNQYDDPRDDSGAFIAGMVAGQVMSQPVYDPTPFDSGPSYDPGFDSGSSDSGGFDSGGFDSGDSGGGGDTGDW